MSEPNPAVHSAHGPARHFPARWEHLPRVGHHNIHPDDAPARRGGPGRCLEPPVDPGPSPTKVKTGLVHGALGSKEGLKEGLVGWTRRMIGCMLLLALSVVLLGTARAQTQ